MISSVRQGTVLGTFVFLISLDIDTDVISFADDTQIFCGINDTAGSENLILIHTTTRLNRTSCNMILLGTVALGQTSIFYFSLTLSSRITMSMI